MDPPRVLILHGWQGSSLHAELGALAAAPGDGERVVCAHSLGCVLWLREAARVAPTLRARARRRPAAGP